MADGRDGRDGLDGERGPRGRDGVNGKDGKDGRDGRDGVDGISIRGDPGPQGERGPRGSEGPIGPMPRHEWKGTELRFEIEPDVWGKFVDLQGPRGERGRPGFGGGIIQQGGSAGGSGVGVPLEIAAGEVFTIPANQQAPLMMTIDVLGTLVIDGYLVGVA